MKHKGAKILAPHAKTCFAKRKYNPYSGGIIRAQVWKNAAFRGGGHWMWFIWGCACSNCNHSIAIRYDVLARFIGKIGRAAVVVFGGKEYTWGVTDEMTGCRITTNNATKRAALQVAESKIKEVGVNRYFEGRDKFLELVLGGRHIKEFRGKRASEEKLKAYYAWCAATRAGAAGEKGKDGQG